MAINRNIIPTVQVAVQMYSGTLTTEQTFGIDPLEQQLAKKDIRKTAFKNQYYFPRFDVIFQAIANRLFFNAVSVFQGKLRGFRQLVSHTTLFSCR